MNYKGYEIKEGFGGYEIYLNGEMKYCFINTLEQAKEIIDAYCK